MVVTHKLKMDLEKRGHVPRVEVSQGDVCTRQIRLLLFSGHAPWQIPEDCQVVICYQKQNGKTGEYDTMPDGQQAWTVSGNELNIMLAPQVMSLPGLTMLRAVLIQKEKVLNTFEVEVCVHETGLVKGQGTTKEYFSFSGVLPAPDHAGVGKYIRVLEVDERGKVIRVEAAESADEDTVREMVDAYLAENPPASGGGEGVSPQAQVTQTESGAVISVTDKNGTSTAEILHGVNGKSAYEYARDGGYTGTEEAFALKMSEEALKAFYVTLKEDGSSADKSNTEIYEAYMKGRTVCCILPMMDNIMLSAVFISEEMAIFSGNVGEMCLAVMIAQDAVSFNSVSYATEDDLAEELPNPYDIYLYKGDKHIRYNGDRSTECYVPVIMLNKVGNTATITVQDEGEEQSITIVEGTGSTDSESVPDYWQTALETGAQAINTAMLEAGYNKSAFLFYTDAHWDYGAQMSPKLLKYLYQHTAMNKTFFGGDIVNNEADDGDIMSYLWDWRNQLKGLPNHHSVPGNHDDGNATDNLFSEAYVYGYLLGAEETPDVVRGDAGLYYYIDSPAEKTRYLFLDTAYQTILYDEKQVRFVVDTLKTTLADWHIVVVAHIWYDTDYTVTPPAVSSLSPAGTMLLNLFDKYNSRGSGTISVSGSNSAYNFADCGGRVEFCVGGHTHWDYDGMSTGGIPVILCETDSKHVRSGLGFTAGTITEASVNGIVANYDTGEIKVVRIGRGESRVVVTGRSEGTAYTNQLPLATDMNGTVYNEKGYKENTRISVSSGSVEDRTESPWYATGFIPVEKNAVVRLKNCTMKDDDVNDPSGRVAVFYATADKAPIGNVGATGLLGEAGTIADGDGNIVAFTVWSDSNIAYVRIVCQYLDENSIITVNEEIG